MGGGGVTRIPLLSFIDPRAASFSHTYELAEQRHEIDPRAADFLAVSIDPRLASIISVQASADPREAVRLR